MAAGIGFALIAGMLWGLVFIAPLMLAEYPAMLLSAGRYLAFGLIALPLGWLDRHNLRRLSAADWREALKLALVGNLLYYLCLASAIQRAGGALPTMIIGTLPVVIAITANRRNVQRDGQLPWRLLAFPLVLILSGILLVNHAEMQGMQQSGEWSLQTYGSGVLLACLAVVCWTWYPVRNADWLRNHPDRSPRSWATAQGLMTLPLSAILMAGIGLLPESGGVAFPFGPTPQKFILLMLAMGLLASWLGTLCWNEASQRLPTALAGQLIVFETLFALLYAFVLRGEFPPLQILAGIILLVSGVILAVRIRPVAAVESAH